MVETEYPNISVIVACLNEEKYIEQCIESLLSSDYKGKFDIYAVDGGSSDRTLDILEGIKLKDNRLKILHNPRRLQSAGRNIAIETTDANYVAYLDARREADVSWLSQLWDCFKEVSAMDDRVLGVGSTQKYVGQTKFRRAQAHAFSSVLSGAGGTNFLKLTEVHKTDHACMCLYDKKYLINQYKYDDDLPVGEDIELNHRMTIINGLNLYVNPKAVNYYYPRENFQKLFWQQLRYGYWRQVVLSALSFKASDNSKAKHIFSAMRVKTVVPGIFVSILTLSFLLSFVSNMFFFAYYSIMASYIIIISLVSLWKSIFEKTNFIELLIVFIAIHFGYGVGVAAYYLKIKNI